MKIKVFKFEVCNWAVDLTDEQKNARSREALQRISNEEDIENTINNFIENKDVLQIITNNIDVNYHNNGRYNTIQLVYTILYK